MSILYNKFDNVLLRFIRLAGMKTVYINNSVQIKLLTKLRLDSYE